MPITLLDILLLVVMLVSGLLAMIRGFMREILSIGAWGVAALATLYAYARVLPIAKGYFSSDMVATGVTVGGSYDTKTGVTTANATLNDGLDAKNLTPVTASKLLV